MVEFKCKSLTVTIGSDAIGQIVATTDGGACYAMPLDMFLCFFEASNDDAKEWLKALDRRNAPVPFGLKMIHRDDGSQEIQMTGKPPGA